MLLLMVLLLAAGCANAQLSYTNECFVSTMFYMDCKARDLALIPPGYWPGVYELYLQDNHITEIHKFDFTGFPNVGYLYLTNNALHELDLESLSPMAKLDWLKAENNMIERVVGDGEQQFSRLRYVYLSDNNITHIDPHLFANAPYLQDVFLRDNPLVVPQGQPVLVNKNLQRLFVDFTSSLSLGEESFSGLPNLRYVYLKSSGITNITGAFVSNTLLTDIEIEDNLITEVIKGTFASAGAVRTLIMDGNPIERFDVSAVADALATKAYLSIRDTPLACSCGYEALYWWAKAKELYFFASCGGASVCAFTR